MGQRKLSDWLELNPVEGVLLTVAVSASESKLLVYLKLGGITCEKTRYLSGSSFSVQAHGIG